MKEETKDHLVKNGKKLFGFKKAPSKQGVEKLLAAKRIPKQYPLSDLGDLLKSVKKVDKQAKKR